MDLQIRNAVRAAYNAQKWRDRVDGMKDDQVLAIYFNLKKQGKV